MHTAAQTALSNGSLWGGRVISALVSAFLLFDSALKALALPAAIEATTRLGYPASLVRSLGIVELMCLAAFLIPRTSILGAILLTGYLGGATATQVRLEDPWFIFPVLVGVLVWAGLYLRDQALRALLPLRKNWQGKASERITSHAAFVHGEVECRPVAKAAAPV